MATYFPGNSEIEGDGLQTLILMNPSYVGYTDTHHQPPVSNFVFLNSATTAGNSIHPQNLTHAPPNQTQQFVSFPLQASTSAVGSASPHYPHHPSVHSQPDISASHGLIPRVHFNMYSSIDPTAGRNLARAQQGLSLSLSSQQTVHGAPQTVSQASGGDDVGVSGGSPSSATGIPNGGNGVQRSLLSSKFLKAAQELLDEVVNVGKGVKNELGKRKTSPTGQSYESSAVAGEGLNGRGTSVKGGGELTMTERQEIQMKKAKLFNMLEEVHERYIQYHNQMDMVVCWFEHGAGIGSAKTYTALALETISRQFRCLKDAIRGQIRAASKSLGEEEIFRGRTSEVSRLKLVDNQLRLQQRALQHLGMIQPNAWRPQRGLPERSVSVLRAWLFEHFLHPYPKDSDKVMLAKQTGLTRSQVSNWFINARVRLWKPMVEEMYLEETKEQEQIKGSEDKTNEHSQTKSNTQQQNPPPPPNISVNIGNQTESLIPQGCPKKQRTLETLLSPNANGVHLTHFNGEFGSLTQIGEIGRFGADQFPATYPGNNGSVSLTLGLPHRENLSISGTHESFLPNPLGGRVEIGEPNDQFGSLNTPTTSSHSTAVYDQDIDLRNQKRFVAQLLPDFVA